MSKIYKELVDFRLVQKSVIEPANAVLLQSDFNLPVIGKFIPALSYERLNSTLGGPGRSFVVDQKARITGNFLVFIIALQRGFQTPFTIGMTSKQRRPASIRVRSGQTDRKSGV